MNRVKKFQVDQTILERVEKKLKNLLSIKKELHKNQNVNLDLLFSPDCGLCSNGLDLLPSKYRKALFKTWKHYSGKSLYPVHTSEELTPQQEFDYCSGSKYTGKYGKYRLKLAKHVLKLIQKDLKKFK